jgi:hypothetical protein
LARRAKNTRIKWEIRALLNLLVVAAIGRVELMPGMLHCRQADATRKEVKTSLLLWPLEGASAS